MLPAPHTPQSRRLITLVAMVTALMAATVVVLLVARSDAGAPGPPAERRAGRPLVGTGPPSDSPAMRAPCFGAASRDPASRCRNSALRLVVTPTPDQAEEEPNAVCHPVGQTDILLPCEFGVRKERARATFALIGDSHASHWRATLDRVAKVKGWRGVSITRSSCPFSRAIAALPGPDAVACARWNRAVLYWLRTHPEVRMIFVAQHRGGEVLRPPEVTTEAAQIAGYRQAWQAVPANVRRIFVFRDTPRDTSRSADCVRRAIRARRSAGQDCAVPRSFAVKRDAAVVAARRLASPRVRLVDLTRYMCSPRLCRPVVGGALVHKDVDHLTQAFAATLAPYLQRRVDRVLAEAAPAAPAPAP